MKVSLRKRKAPYLVLACLTTLAMALTHSVGIANTARRQ